MPTPSNAGVNSGTDQKSKLEREKVENDERWVLVQGIINDPVFHKSPRLCQFLSYITERTILGRQQEINEQQIGVHIFDRAPNYNSSEDNIVRSHARLLRKKLDEYYAVPGRLDPVRIVVPRGGYTPSFDTVPVPVFVEPPAVEPVSPRRRWRTILGIATVAALLLPGSAWLLYQRTIEKSPEARFNQFWGQILNTERPSLIVPSDTALVLYQQYAGKDVSLTDYVKGQFSHGNNASPSAEPAVIAHLDSLPYTNLVDLNFSWQLARRSKADLRKTSIRAPRDLRTSDLKAVNAILIGARRANPWVELFDRNNSFQGLFNPELRDHVLNRTPQGSEPQVFQSVSQRPDGVSHAYAIVAFVPGLTGQENVLLLSGTTTAGTEGAADFVLNESSLGGFLETITPAGTHRVPHFELVLDVESVSASAPRAKIVASRVRHD